jgi:hypothetical protein
VARVTWKQLLASNRVRPHTTSQQELDALRSIVERDLVDAGLVGLSDDRRFATAYNAALQLAKIAIACAGYRVSGLGAHQTSFEAAELSMGTDVSALTLYFETCRRKRNTLDYDVANIISDGEATEILQKVKEFRQVVEAWIAENHPQYIR